MGKGLLGGVNRFESLSDNNEMVASTEKKNNGKSTRLGRQSANPLFGSPAIRLLPAELKLRILQLSHPEQSATALFAALYEASNKSGIRKHGPGNMSLGDIIKERGVPAIPMSVTDMAKMIGRSPHPNMQRDMMSSGLGKQRPAILHPDIELKTAGFIYPTEPTPFEKEQALALLNTNFSKLEQLGKSDAATEPRVVGSVTHGVQWGRPGDNLNRHNTFAPSSSAVYDAMLLGLTARLTKLKMGPTPALKLVSNLVSSSNSTRTNRGPLIRSGGSAEGLYEALRDMLMNIVSFKKTPEDQKTVLDLFVEVMNNPARFSLDHHNQIRIAVAFCDALSAFGDSKIGSNGHRMDQMALTEFRSLLSAAPVYSGANQYSSRIRTSLQPFQRANIIGLAAAGLAEKSSKIRNSPIEEGESGEISSLVDQSWTIVPWRSSLQTSVLQYMLDALKLEPQEKDFHRLNVFFAVENRDGWAGLLSIAPKLDNSSQKKIYAGFLNQIKKSTVLLDMSSEKFAGANRRYKKLRAAAAISLSSLNDCRVALYLAFQQVKKNLPTVQDPQLAERISACHAKYVSLLPEKLQ